LLGPDAALAPELPLVSFDPKGGREFNIALRNNYPSIQNYVVELSGQGVTFLPARTDISIAAATERDIPVRVFSDTSSASKRPASIRVSGAADFTEAFEVLPIPRGATVTYARDLDGDGVVDVIIENQRVRASFSGADGRWLEWIWKDSSLNLLPDSGLLPEPDRVRALVSGSAIEIRSSNGLRKVSLSADNRLTIEEERPLPKETLASGKKDGVTFSIERPTPNRAVYMMEQSQ
jgi:hypothetical protein